jgi:hypothetical protein
MHFLHATGWSEQDGTEIGRYVLHFADGQTRPIPLVYGEDLRDWVVGSKPDQGVIRATVAWTGTNVFNAIRLFKTTWENPAPAVRLETIDFVSAQTACSPFLIAITLE